MTWKKFFTKSVELLEFVASFWPSEEEIKRRTIQDNENMYDAAYYSGTMSYSLAESCKEDFKNRL